MLRVLILAALIWPLTACRDRTPTAAEPSAPASLPASPAMPGDPVSAGLDKPSLTQLLQAHLEERYQHPANASQLYLSQARLHGDRSLAQDAWRTAQRAGSASLALEAVTLWRSLFDQASANASFALSQDDVAMMHALCEQALQAQRWAEAMFWQLSLDRYGHHDAIDSMLETWMATEQPMPRDALRAQVDTYLKQYPSHDEAHIVCAALLAGDERYPEAFQRLNDVLHRHPDNLDALFAKALVEQRLGHLEAALKTVHTAMAHGGQQEFRFGLLRIDIELDLPGATLADRHIHQFVQQLPASARAINELTQFLLDHHHADAAQRLMEHYPLTEQEAQDAGLLAHRQALRGVTADQLDDVDAALRAFQQVTPASPLFAHAQLRLLTLTQESQGNDAAAQLMRHQRERFPDQLLLLVQLEFSALQQAQQPEQASALLEQIVDAYPEHDGLRYLRAMQRMAQQQIPQALSDLQLLVEHQPHNPIFLNAYGYMLADQKQDYAQAVPLLRRAITLAPDNAEIQDSLGWALYGQGQYDEARQWLARAYNALPSPEVARHYLQALMATHNEAEAQRILGQLYRSSSLDQAARSALLQQFPTLRAPSP
ncbi:tetratricopeptide repeat protein [Zymobacter palmae]|uniref:Tetratricopeptide TPR_4 n=1 Tax=Zymobacter palmae TaxID=33074 RepID=A0A348HH01_9GAMM|nr:tetratricopeptide repeat protein [Zymobacter palmae]BBG30903.1 tetratricopeptide TPR_4 [Zymobacter palmae]